MPFPRWLDRVNSHVTNRLLGPLARRSPGMPVVVHAGRKLWAQGRMVQNVLARHGCELETTRNCGSSNRPSSTTSNGKKMPVFVRFFLGLLFSAC